VTDQTYIHREIKNTLNLDNSYAIQFSNFCLPNFISKNMINCIKLYLTFCFASLILKVEHRLRVFENRVLTRIFGPKTVCNKRQEKLHKGES
jgi:hypothetical protein